MKHQEEYNELRIKRVLLLDKIKSMPIDTTRLPIAEEIKAIDARLKEIESVIGQTFINGKYKATPGKVESNLQPFFNSLARIFIFILIVTSVSMVIWFLSFKAHSKPEQYKRPEIVVKVQQEPKKQVKSYIVDATYYHATPNECDSKPLITADGSEIDTSKLQKGFIRWVSLSRDLLQRWGGEYKYGDTIRVEHENPLLCGLWIIHDCMNKRFKQKIDFLVPVGTPIPGLSHGLQITKYNLNECSKVKALQRSKLQKKVIQRIDSPRKKTFKG